MIEKGSEVQFHYTLTVGEVEMDTSRGAEPLSYVHGEGQIIPGLEEELAGLKVGDTKQVTVVPDKGYGERDDEAVQTVPRSAFGDADGLEVGDMVSGHGPDGRTIQASVTALDEEQVTLDMNHPLAGKTLTFAVEIIAIA